MPEPSSPVRLLELAAGYQRSQTLFALIELGIPTLLAERPYTLDEIAARVGVDPVAADRFLSACVALALLNRKDEVFSNAPDARRFLVRGSPTYLGDMFQHLDRASYPAWPQLAERLRTWHPGACEGERAALSDDGAAGIRAQHRLSLLFGEALGGACDLSAHRRLLDLGGGTGAMSIALCRRHPDLRAIVLEQPVIAAEARRFVSESGLEERIEVREGDFTREPLPGGCDAVLLANLMSLATSDANCTLLRRVHDALPAGGIVMLSGWMLDDDRTGPLLPVLFCLEDINWGAPDVERSTTTYAEWLEGAGFKVTQRGMYLEPASLMVGRKG